MDRAERLTLGFSLGLLGLFFIAVVYASAGRNVGVPTCIVDREPFERDTLFERQPGVYELQMIARMWEFRPGEIRLPPGSTVDLYLTSLDVIHGFMIEDETASKAHMRLPALMAVAVPRYTGQNVNLMAVPGAVTYARVRFDRPGRYKIVCHEYCGDNHHFMNATILVQ
ncbi:MAG: cytochrome C oxidase subunit II [Bacteroidetes bacterium]|nr:cytochrome C oxidase subunit II [Rhodothermia bacterium]MCS7155458.1 cytochrome C oxidase subunit II [Bacteroidota bacterium]MCX7907449.1 cytochrome C oxidase subunit II [Bacteroidota bacterium]MDW8138443.1 cytochrome C oxidase subunit II [Bacteroidota bacterium]MDW8284620.1 cytochrome C oxidase subunit II [Bacteroidota bacterium]